MKPLVLVVGAAGGIGSATAESLCGKGFDVVAADRDAGKLSRLVRPGLETLELDITDRQGVLAAAESFSSRGLTLRAVVIAAAVHSTHPAEYLTDEVIDSVLEVNLSSHIKLIRDFLPHVEEGGSIIGVSSIAACVGVPMSSMYSASKWGLEGFYESLHAELSCRRIRVSIIQPGNVNTGFNETGNSYTPSGGSRMDRRYEQVVSRIDSKYGIDPALVAGVIARVISLRRPRFCYIVGSNARKASWAKKLLGRDAALRLMSRFFGF
jgi:NAD(P)-dependent dehydrogenase (short-subunit alcohol dehydrogenase family)